MRARNPRILSLSFYSIAHIRGRYQSAKIGQFVTLRYDKIFIHRMRETVSVKNRQKFIVKSSPNLFSGKKSAKQTCLSRETVGLCLKPKGHQTLLYSTLGQVNSFIHKVLFRFWDNKLQFWPERLHISKKRGQNRRHLFILQPNECLERQPSRSINAVGKDDNCRQWSRESRQQRLREYAGVWFGQYGTPPLFPRQSKGTFHKIPPAHPRDSRGLSRSRTVVGKVAVEVVENCPSSTLLTSLVLHPYIQSTTGVPSTVNQVCPLSLFLYYIALM